MKKLCFAVAVFLASFSFSGYGGAKGSETKNVDGPAADLEEKYWNAYENCVQLINQDEAFSARDIDVGLAAVSLLTEEQKADVFILVDEFGESGYFSEVTSEHWLFTIGDTSDLNYCQLVCDSETEEVVGEIPVAAVCVGDALGITLSASHVSSDGLTLTCIQSGPQPSGEIFTGAPYFLEKKADKKWEPLAFKNEIVFEDLAWIIQPDKKSIWDIHWSEAYGSLPPGLYRIGKTISAPREDGSYEDRTYYAEFEIAK